MEDSYLNMGENESGEQTFYVNESDPQYFAGNESEQHTVAENEYEQNNLDGNEAEQHFAPDQNFETEPGQNYNGNETEQNFTENEEHVSSEHEVKQDVDQNQPTETDELPQNSHHEEKQQPENNVAASGGEKKWPGWPGESVFRILVPVKKVGNIIGRKGEYIKKMVEESKARIKVLDAPPRTTERAVMVSAKEDPDATITPAMNALLRVHKRVVDGLDGDSAPPPGGKVSTRLLVPASQSGSLIGKQGATVKSIQEASNCVVRVLGADELPIFALRDDRVVEVVGEPAAVHKAVEIIASHLRKFLVDRSIIPIFEAQMQAPPPHVEHMPPQPSWGPPRGLPPSAMGPGYGPPNPQYMPPPRQLDSYYPPPAEMGPPAHQGISAYGREPTLGAHAPANPQAPASTMIPQVTQHMQIPLAYADAVIGTNGASISYIRRASGATVTVQESRGAPGEMTVEINGTASQVQAAQQLIQNFMAEAAAPAPAPAQAAAPADQGGYNQAYNAYGAAPAAVYGSPPASAGHATQPGAYGSVYGANYGY